MAGSSSEEEMESVLLPNLDLIYQDFKNAIAEIELLKSNSNAELKIREALQFTTHSLRQENERLTKLQSESLHNLADQLERRTKCQSLKEELKRVSDERLHQEYEHRKSMDLLKQDYTTKVGDLEAQIHRGLLLEKARNEATINLLRQDLTVHKTHVQTLAKRLDRVHFDVESKYDLEIQDLKDCLMIEQEEKNELSRKIQELEKELLISRTKLVAQQRDTVSSRLVETLKLKIMKLRKENEILRRQLPCSEDGLRDGI
ncbi:protein At-4/1-like isoform X1 [Quercus robur]|uniref:protein At-4/1-like isoform X1 n=1 Tax=Quercus robur TaxID=38942 RepID=UPI0021629D5E|nr:protein At-4/1-like isoform X1 [Quercus robur]XP_050283538.1 protein At-4/1-like isoform X1 [Quercus robur]